VVSSIIEDVNELESESDKIQHIIRASNDNGLLDSNCTRTH
jgi:hypothetical protein